MNTKIKKIRKGRFILALMIITLSIFGKYDDSLHAEALPNFPEGVDLVSAADCIMSYLTSAGMFIANRDWIDELYTSFGGGAGFYINDLYQNGLLTLDEAGHYVSTGLDTALESQSAWSSLHLDELFQVSAQEAAVGGGVAATGAGTIAGAIGGVATTGALPLAIGVTGAYWGGISLGTLIAHGLGLYGKNILYDIPVSKAFDEIRDNIVIGQGYVFAMTQYQSSSNPQYVSLVGNGYPVIYKNGNSTYLQIVTDYNGSLAQGTWYQGSPNGFNKYENQYLNISVRNDGYAYQGISANKFESFQDYQTWLNGWKNGNITPNKFAPYSSDIITPSGNASGEYSQSGGISVPSLVPEVDPTGQSVVPGGASQEDWLRWANGAKGNNEINQPDNNAEIFEQILEAIRRLSPTPTPNPNPNPNPNPTPVPKPDYDPSQPDQPEYDPKETEGPSDVTNGNPWTTPDLLDKFPFCLPRDVLRCFEKLDGGARQAPSISWHFTTPLGINFDFDLDLDDYEGIASLLRTLELIAFVIGLALATRNLIGR